MTVVTIGCFYFDLIQISLQLVAKAPVDNKPSTA